MVSWVELGRIIRSELYRNYEEYQWDFPNSNIKTDIRKAALKNQIELLQAELKALEDTDQKKMS